MSNQGNVIVVVAGEKIIVTSGRHAGPQTPKASQDCLREALRHVPVEAWGHKEWRPWETFLQELVHLDCMERPIFGLGNEDVPTIVVDFDNLTVTWESFSWGDASRVVGKWPFTDYLKIDMEKNPTVVAEFE